MKKRALVFASFVVMLSSPTIARADAFDAALTRAVAAKELALDHPEPTKWQIAFERFREADEIGPSAETKYELGFAAAQLRQEDLALEYYEIAIQDGLTGPARDKAQRYVDANGPRMARVLLRGSTGSRVRIRGIERASLPLEHPLVVYAGNVTIEVVDPVRSVAESCTVTLKAGRVTPIDCNLADAVQPATRLPASSLPPMPVRDPSTRLQAPALKAPQLGPEEATTVKGSSGRTAGRWLLGSSAGVLLSSGTMLAISMVKLSDQRRQLREACDVPLPGSEDGCSNAEPGRYDEAVGLAEDIARWRTVQGAAWVGVGVGVLGTAVGWAMLSRSSTDVQTAARWVPSAAVGQRAAYVVWRQAF